MGVHLFSPSEIENLILSKLDLQVAVFVVVDKDAFPVLLFVIGFLNRLYGHSLFAHKLLVDFNGFNVAHVVCLC